MNEINNTNAALSTAQYNALTTGTIAGNQGAKILIHPALQGLGDLSSNLALAEPSAQANNDVLGQTLLDGTPRQQERLIIDALIRTLNVILTLVTKVVDLISQKAGNTSDGQVSPAGSSQSGASGTNTTTGAGSQTGSTDATTGSATGTGSSTGASSTAPTDGTTPSWTDDLKGVGEQGKSFLDGAKELISQFSDVAIAIGAILLGKGTGIMKLGKGLFKNAKKIFKTLSKGAGKLFSKGKDFFKDTFGGIIEGGKSLLKKIF